MLVSDAVGTLFFATLIVWNSLSESGCAEITILCSLAIGCTVAFEILFARVSARCTQHPWRDFWALLQHEIMAIYMANWLITVHVARHTLVHLPILEHVGGYVNHALVLYNRNKMDVAQRDARRVLVREQHDMSYWTYVAMLNLVTLPHNVLRYHVRWMILRLARPPSPPASADGGDPATIAHEMALWCAAYVALFFGVYRRSPLPLWLAKVDCRWYQCWHRWFHEDPLLWRCVHKFHHLFKKPTPLVSSTETHIEWCMSWAGCHTFCNPFYQINLFMYDGVEAIEMHTHDVLSDKPVLGGPDGFHLLHHKDGNCNFSVPDWDRYYGTITRERHFDDYFPHRATLKTPTAADGNGCDARAEKPKAS